jgi:outer membrane immunogenic protein
MGPQMTALANQILISGLALGFGIGTALAADLPTHKAAPVFAPAPAPINWTGFYLGVNGGYGGDAFNYPFDLGYADPTVPVNEAINGSAKLNSSGFLGGVTAGFNWQFAPTWVAGFEGDLDFAAINGKVSLNGATSAASTYAGSASASIGSQTPYIDTARLRLGYLVTDQFLVYGTGGLAYGGTNNSLSASANIPAIPFTGGFSASKNITGVGWTGGAGAEFKIDKHWSFKAEYLYADLGTATILSGSGTDLLGGTNTYNYSLKVHTTDNIMRVGVNYTFN